MTADAMILTIINIFSLMISIISAIMIVYGVVQYAKSGGDPQKIALSKNTIFYAVIGIVVVFLSYGITNFVIAQIQGSTEAASPGVTSPFTWDVTPVLAVAGSMSLPTLTLIALRRNSRVLQWIARFSALWVHHEDRADHREDMWFALHHAPLFYRIRLTWELMLLSPLSGSRNRRHKTQLAAAIVTESQQAGPILRTTEKTP